MPDDPELNDLLRVFSEWAARMDDEELREFRDIMATPHFEGGDQAAILAVIDGQRVLREIQRTPN